MIISYDTNLNRCMYFHQCGIPSTFTVTEKEHVFTVFITSRVKGGYKGSKLLHDFFVMQEKLHKTLHFKICFLLRSYIKRK